MNKERVDAAVDQLYGYRKEVAEELENILSFWTDHTQDFENGGFVSHLDPDGRADDSIPKGAVLNARILWAFSAAYNATSKAKYKLLAERSYNYFKTHFFDAENGGIYWSVDKSGAPENDRKQIYALAFAIYGLSEYYKMSIDEEALERSINLYHWIEKYSFDHSQGGYIEAVGKTGAALEDMRLSAKDHNAPKTMNTHLHVLEGYANLYTVWKNGALKISIEKLLQVFLDNIVDSNNKHLQLFFDKQWKPTAEIISYGHDIEASWLLLEAAERIENEVLIEKVKILATKMAKATAENLQDDGSLYHEKDLSTGHVDKHREWWVSAEAMVGFLNAYEITGHERFLKASLRSWQYAKNRLIDKESGEWFWARNDDGSINENKVGFWKCPYHNARACMEVMRRIDCLMKD